MMLLTSQNWYASTDLLLARHSTRSSRALEMQAAEVAGVEALVLPGWEAVV